MGPGERRDSSLSSCSKRGPMPRPESVNSRPRAAQSRTGCGRPRQDRGEGPNQVAGSSAPCASPASAPREPLREGPPKRRLCARTARAAEVQVSRAPGSAVSAVARPLGPLPPLRLGADLDSSRTGHREPPPSSAPRSAACRTRLAKGATGFTSPPSRTKAWTTFGGGLGRSHSGGARGVRCRGSSPVQPTPCRRRRPICFSARDFSVAFATSGPLDSAAAAAAAAADRGDGGAALSWKDVSASRRGKRTGGSGGCHSKGPEPRIDRARGSRPSLPVRKRANWPLRDVLCWLGLPIGDTSICKPCEGLNTARAKMA
mmetsp:Transcript_29897/g.85653  ORF Transcript_29897/g.85653 Transcript_29897/m.85653 type:complete len:316 (-) Transcript_29897:8-955(-)